MLSDLFKGVGTLLQLCSCCYLAVSVLNSFLAVPCVGLFFFDCGIAWSYLLVFVFMVFLFAEVLSQFPVVVKRVFFYLPHSDKGWSMVCIREASWSCALDFYSGKQY